MRSLIRLIVLQFLTQMNLFSDQTAKPLELTCYEVVSRTKLKVSTPKVDSFMSNFLLRLSTNYIEFFF